MSSNITHTHTNMHTLIHCPTHTWQYDTLGKMALSAKWHSAIWHVEKVSRMALGKVAYFRGYVHAILKLLLK